jgi:hypothetical protein
MEGAVTCRSFEKLSLQLQIMYLHVEPAPARATSRVECAAASSSTASTRRRRLCCWERFEGRDAGLDNDLSFATNGRAIRTPVLAC